MKNTMLLLCGFCLSCTMLCAQQVDVFWMWKMANHQVVETAPNKRYVIATGGNSLCRYCSVIDMQTGYALTSANLAAGFMYAQFSSNSRYVAFYINYDDCGTRVYQNGCYDILKQRWLIQPYTGYNRIEDNFQFASDNRSLSYTSQSAIRASNGFMEYGDVEQHRLELEIGGEDALNPTASLQNIDSLSSEPVQDIVLLEGEKNFCTISDTYGSCTINSFELATGKRLARYELLRNEEILCCAVHPQGKYAVTISRKSASSQPLLKIHTIGDASPLTENIYPAAQLCAFTASGKDLWLSDGKRLSVFSFPEAKLLRTTTFDTISSFTISGDGKYCLVKSDGYGTTTYTLCSASSLSPLRRIPGIVAMRSKQVFSPNLEYILQSKTTEDYDLYEILQSETGDVFKDSLKMYNEPEFFMPEGKGIINRIYYQYLLNGDVREGENTRTMNSAIQKLVFLSGSNTCLAVDKADNLFLMRFPLSGLSGVEDVTQGKGVCVCNDKLLVEEESKVRLYTTTGAVVIEQQITTTPTLIDLSQQAAGVYMVEIEKASGITRKSLLLQH